MIPITITSNGKQFCLVQLPEGYHLDWTEFKVEGDKIRGRLFKCEGHSGTLWWETLPPGHWQILGTGTADKLTEEQMRQVVENVGGFMFYLYPLGSGHITNQLLIAFSTLLRSYSLDPSTTVILEKK